MIKKEVIFKKYEKYENAFTFSFFPNASEMYLIVVSAIPKSVNENIRITIESTSAYNPNNSGNSILANKIDNMNPPNFAINDEEIL